MRSAHKYQVALSFAGEQRAYVVEVAQHLAARSIAVFYDRFETTQLWGKDGAEKFRGIYSADAAYVVMFISRDYVNKSWTRHEYRSALGRMLNEDSEFILPVRFDNELMPGLPDTMLYLNANEYSPAELSAEIARKLGVPTFSGKASHVPAPQLASPFGDVKVQLRQF